MQDIRITIILSIFIALVVYYDLRFKKIYNCINIPLFLLGMIFNFYLGGIYGLYHSILGALAGFFVLLFPQKWKWVGGGDVKFLTAAGAMIGARGIAQSTLIGLILFGIAALIFLIYHRRIKQFFKQLMLTLFTWKYIKGISMIEVTGSLPLGVFLGLGILVHWYYQIFCL